MYGFGKFGNENLNARKSVLSASSSSQSFRNSHELVFDSNKNDLEAIQLSEADIQKRSQQSGVDSIKGLPDRNLLRKHLSGNSKPCYRRKILKKSNFPKLEHVFQSSNKIAVHVPKKLEAFRSKNMQRKNRKTTNDKGSAKTSIDIFRSPSSSQIKAVDIPTHMGVETFGLKFVNHNNHNNNNQQETEISLTHVSKEFADNIMKSKSRTQIRFSRGNVNLVASSSNLMKSECGIRNDIPDLRIASNPSRQRYIDEDCDIVWPSSELDGVSGTSKEVLTRSNVDPYSLHLLNDLHKRKLIAHTNVNEDYNIVWSSSDSEDGAKSSKVITNQNANEDYNIIWSSSDSEDEKKKKSLTVKSIYKVLNTELNLLVQEIEKDRRQSNAIKEKYVTKKVKKGGYSEKFKNTLVKAKMDFGFLDYEQSTGILQGMFAVVTKIEKSYGVSTANLKLENDNCFRVFLEKRVESANDGDKLVSFVNNSRFYTVNGLNIFIQPNKVVYA